MDTDTKHHSSDPEHPTRPSMRLGGVTKEQSMADLHDEAASLINMIAETLDENKPDDDKLSWLDEADSMLQERQAESSSQRLPLPIAPPPSSRPSRSKLERSQLKPRNIENDSFTYMSASWSGARRLPRPRNLSSHTPDHYPDPLDIDSIVLSSAPPSPPKNNPDLPSEMGWLVEYASKRNAIKLKEQS